MDSISILLGCKPSSLNYLWCIAMFRFCVFYIGVQLNTTHSHTNMVDTAADEEVRQLL